MAYKSRSITSKASSACKMNMGLVMGAADVANSKRFKDHSDGLFNKFSKRSSKPRAVAEKDPNSKDKDPNSKDKDPNSKDGEKVSTDSTKTPEV